MATGARPVSGNFTISAKEYIIGAKVINAAQEDLGKIEDLILDTRNSRVRYAILSFGGILGMGHKHFAIPWDALTFDRSEKIALLNMEKERLKNAPGFDQGNWPNLADSEWGVQIYTHYGYTPYWE